MKIGDLELKALLHRNPKLKVKEEKRVVASPLNRMELPRQLSDLEAAAVTEDYIQSKFIEWCRLYQDKYPPLALVHSIPNGSFKSGSARGLFKATGLLAGIPDICIPLARQGFNAFYIEFKSRKKGAKLSDNQKVIHGQLRAERNKVEVFSSSYDAALAVCYYLNIETGVKA